MRAVIDIAAIALALLACRSVAEALPLREVLSQLNTQPSPMRPAELESLILKVRSKMPMITCTHAALAFRALHGGALHLGVIEGRPHLGHAWVVDEEGREWLKGSGPWKAVWVEGK